MMTAKKGSSLPGAAEMAACFRDPHRKKELEKRIMDHYSSLRGDVPRSPKKDTLLIRKYSRVMARLRMEEETLLKMLESFARGDADSVREASSKLTNGLKDRKYIGDI